MIIGLVGSNNSDVGKKGALLPRSLANIVGSLARLEVVGGGVHIIEYYAVDGAFEKVVMEVFWRCFDLVQYWV